MQVKNKQRYGCQQFSGTGKCLLAQVFHGGGFIR
jgi:hypothetical protein